MLSLWIKGKEVKVQDNSQLFQWFLAREGRLALIDNIVYLCATPTKGKRTFKQKQHEYCCLDPYTVELLKWATNTR